MTAISTYLQDLQQLLQQLDEQEIQTVIDVLTKARKEGRMIFTMGNGGSASTASHFVNGLSQGATAEGKPRFRAVALTDNLPNVLAYANDLGYENIFVEQLKNLLTSGDIVIGISGSGNSPNVLNAIDYAKKHDAVTIGITGYDGGKLKKAAEYSLHVPSHFMEMVEDVHLALTHLMASYFREH